MSAGEIASIYPADIPVGVVVDVFRDEGKQSITAFVKPFVDFARLEEVVVLTNHAQHSQ